MKYLHFLEQDHFEFESLLAFAYGNMIDDPPADFDARLPAPPFLMIDRIVSLEKNGSRGKIIAEQDIRLDAWYFQCHFSGDPVQPGCLCVDAVWQLIGFYCVWRGALGAGRALGCDQVAFNGQIRPHNRVARYEIDIVRFQGMKNSGASMVIGDAEVFIDGESIATMKRARAGVFKNITYRDYPKKSANAVGGASGK
ncbi:MAG: bifunctional 3-hydroxydecanoyl-ACP dehydratase/trans-2-decenoyl-ACP isomerase [Desulfosalsimonadaceae bacterium]